MSFAHTLDEGLHPGTELAFSTGPVFALQFQDRIPLSRSALTIGMESTPQRSQNLMISKTTPSTPYSFIRVQDDIEPAVEILHHSRAKRLLEGMNCQRT